MTDAPWDEGPARTDEDGGPALTPPRSQRERESGPEGSPWTLIEAEYLIRTPWRHVRWDRVQLHTGEEIRYTYLESPDAVFVVPVTTAGQIVMIRQYRHPPRAWVHEIVAGAVGPEEPAETARRELAEEIGGRCRALVPLGTFWAGVATTTQRSHVFVALDVELGEPSHEATELIELHLLPPDEAFQWARDGRIGDVHSALALLLAEPRVRAHLNGVDRPAG